MTQASQPDTDSSTPTVLVMTLVENRLYSNREFNKYLSGRSCEECSEGECNCPAPDGWVIAAVEEAYTAFTETLDTWVETLIAGRPPTQPLVKWEHRELIDIDDAAEIAANQGHRYG